MKISALYPLTELFCIGFSCVVYLRFGVSIQGALVIAALPIICALFVVDIRRMILPNPLVFSLGMLGVLYCLSALSFTPYTDIVVEHGLGAVLFGAVIYIVSELTSRVLKKSALGFGDVKFFIVVGLWLGLSALPAFMVLSGVFGVLTALVWGLVYKGDGHTGIFPFGPALIVSFLVLLFYHDALVRFIS